MSAVEKQKHVPTCHFSGYRNRENGVSWGDIKKGRHYTVTSTVESIYEGLKQKDETAFVFYLEGDERRRKKPC